MGQPGGSRLLLRFKLTPIKHPQLTGEPTDHEPLHGWAVIFTISVMQNAKQNSSFKNIFL